MIARAEVRADDHLILEAIGPLHEIVQVHVPELVNPSRGDDWAG